MQEDLAALFNKQMTMGPIEAPETPEPSSPVSSQPSSITSSITQHYHHSVHFMRQANQAGPEERQPSPDTHSAPMPTTSDILRSHNIDPSTLSPGQIELFEHAIPEQKSRLVQIWQICSETNQVSTPHQPYANISMEDHDMDGMDMAPEEDNDEDGHQYAESYMISGYEVLARRDYELSAQKDNTTSRRNEPTTGAPYRIASDPIYQSQRWWEHANPQPMEHQYGAFELMNQVAV